MIATQQLSVVLNLSSSLSLSLIVYDRYLNVENTLKHSTIKDYVHIANPLLLSSPPLNKNENR